MNRVAFLSKPTAITTNDDVYNALLTSNTLSPIEIPKIENAPGFSLVVIEEVYVFLRKSHIYVFFIRKNCRASTETRSFSKWTVHRQMALA